jgi:hypothetical protein
VGGANAGVPWRDGAQADAGAGFVAAGGALVTGAAGEPAPSEAFPAGLVHPSDDATPSASARRGKDATRGDRRIAR